jgi:HAD superfamily hydrolase (TIGR01509 family)
VAHVTINAVIFDVDGTLLDTREFIIQAFEYALRTNGHVVPERAHIISTATGRTIVDAYPILAPNGDVIALRDHHNDFQTKNYHLITAYNGLHDVLSALRARNLLLGVCSARAKSTREILGHAEALRYFHAVVDATDVTKHKPHPEGVLKVLELLNTSPENAAMIGDTSADIEAGKAAGCALTIGVTHGLGTRNSLEQAGADHIVNNLPEILKLL